MLFICCNQHLPGDYHFTYKTDDRVKGRERDAAQVTDADDLQIDLTVPRLAHIQYLPLTKTDIL